MVSYWFVFVLLGCVLQTAFICVEYAKKFVLAVIFKGLASVMFILTGTVCLSVTRDARFGGLVLAGLICGGVGDVLLNLPKVFENVKDKLFMGGMAAFLIGHVFYVTALTTRGAVPLLIAAPLTAALSFAILPYTLKRIDVVGKIRTFGIVYIAAVLFMMSCAIGHFILSPGNSGYLLFSAGGVLFTVSDVILVFHLFGRKAHRSSRAWNLITYYLGQILIALAILLI